jgi:hypothetical protein
LPLKPCVSGNLQGGNTSYTLNNGSNIIPAEISVAAATYSTADTSMYGNTSAGVVCPYATLGRDNKTWINRAPLSEFAYWYT